MGADEHKARRPAAGAGRAGQEGALEGGRPAAAAGSPSLAGAYAGGGFLSIGISRLADFRRVPPEPVVRRQRSAIPVDEVGVIVELTGIVGHVVGGYRASPAAVCRARPGKAGQLVPPTIEGCPAQPLGRTGSP